MSDQSFREIQLSGKQLFFLFMASVVVATGVFLLGVSVGRGVGPDAGSGGPAGEQSAQVLPPEQMPPPTVLTPDDGEYHPSLRGTPTPPAQTPPEPAASLSEAEVVDEPVPPAPVTPAPTAKPEPVAPAAATAAAPTAKPAPAGENWNVQVASFRSRENADRQARQLRAKGHAVTTVSSGGFFRVRIGPFATRAEADRTAARIRREEGITPSVSR